DLGCPIDTGDADYGWFLDDLKPTAALSLPRPHANAPLAQIRFGLADQNSGINLATLHVSADFPVSGRAAGAELADLAIASGEDIWTIDVTPPLIEGWNRHVKVSIEDQQGNVTRVARAFFIGGDDTIFSDGFD
ncbi:MAG: hypothetical protein ACREPX_11875, partial [Rhodanobacteraceae bacterium]